MISAQETVPGQAFSNASLTSSMTSYDLSELMFERDNFSPSIVGVSSSNIEASQPCQDFINNSSSTRLETYYYYHCYKRIGFCIVVTLTKQSWNWNRMTEAPLLGSLIMAFIITSRTMDSASGQVSE